MVRALPLATMLLTLATNVARADSLDVAAWAAGLPTVFAVHGSKAEPTWQESVDIRRDGDRLVVTGGAPAWAIRAREVARVTADGMLCMGETGCSSTAAPGGFLASAGLVAAARRHALTGRTALLAFGARQVVCLPGEEVGIAQPILDPCFDRLSGAAIAARHRLSGAFDGPTLDPASLTITIQTVAQVASQHEDPQQ